MDPSGSATFAELAAQLAEIGRHCYARGWALGTSGNFSAVVRRNPMRLAITASGVDKGVLSVGQVVEIDQDAKVVGGSGAPSAEASLHLTIARARRAGAVLHTHSIWGTILSDAATDNGLAIEGYEMLKGLEGVRTHDHREWLPILDNTQDWNAAAPGVEAGFDGSPERARLPDQPAWTLHLGPGSRRGQAAGGDSGVPVRGDGTKARDGMATVRIPAENRAVTDQDAVTRYLATLGIEYERWAGAERIPANAPAESVLTAYAAEIETLKAKGGYVTADIIDVTAQTPGL